MDITSQIENAIEESIKTNSIVHLEHSQELEKALILEADDYVRWNDLIVEFWGTDEDGSEWRIHTEAEEGFQQ